MKQLSIVVVLIALLFSNFKAQAQDKTAKIQSLETKIEAITKEEREGLKQEVKAINQRFDKGELSLEEAQKLKETAAEKRVINIEVRTARLKEEISNLKQETDAEFSDEDDNNYYFHIVKKRKNRHYNRTDSQLVLAVGFNNVVSEGESFGDSDYKFGGSRFLEIGWAWRTPLLKESNFIRFRYGISFQINNLKPTDNRIFVNQNGETVLENFPLDLDKSKLKFTNLVVPVHFEFGPSRVIKRENYKRYSIRKKFKIGLGGYAGFNIGTRQKLIYDDGGERVKEKIKGDFNTSNLVYGLSSYIAWGSTGLYLKYDLSPLFDDNQPIQRNISLGVRFDMD
ncbi:hypothetical protein [Ascidiimonas sp. W6]|uniref:hypothetical protein n=1 Tax=Ascidiimonas meishanensis TaxID=3128903 RepID=UPI0030EB8730